MPIIQIELLEGRTIGQKREIAKKIADIIVEVGKCKTEDVRIIFREMQPYNYAVGGELKADKY